MARMSVWIFLLVQFAPWKVALASSTTSAPQLVRVYIAILAFNCHGFGGHVHYTLRGSGSDVESSATVTRMGSDVYSLTLNVPPDHYHLFIDGKAPNTNATPDICDADEWFTVLPDHERHVATVLGSLLMLHSHCSIAGTLPAAGLVVSLVLLKGTLMQDTVTGGKLGAAPDDVDVGVDIDGSAYYAEDVPDEDYVLMIGQTAIPIDMTSKFNVDDPYCHGEYIHNITPDELKRAFPPEFATE